MLNISDIRAVVHKNINELLLEAQAELREITGAESLNDIGFSSLLLARLIIQLETEIGVDPFAKDMVVSDVRTVDDLVEAYRNSLNAVVTS